jgi:Permease for cytosine/purines, uracil, thiamine, allantoin
MGQRPTRVPAEECVFHAGERGPAALAAGAPDLDRVELFCLLVVSIPRLKDAQADVDRWSESWAVSTWSLGSSLIALGATVRDALLVILFANMLSAVVIVLNGRAASRYHVGYPVLARATFGIYGSYFFVVLRAILGVIWGESATQLGANTAADDDRRRADVL